MYADFKFPQGDVECRMVVPNQVGDVERALKYVKDFSVCVQAGGNVGVWPHYLSNKFDEVYTFEPDIDNFECLNENVKKDNVFAFNVGLGEKSSNGKMVGDKRNCGAYQMEEGGSIQIIPLDDMELKPSLICLDIEGMELLALKGAEKTIKKNLPVIMIEDKGLSDKYGIKKGDAGKYLESLGYELKEAVHRDLVYCAR